MVKNSTREHALQPCCAQRKRCAHALQLLVAVICCVAWIPSLPRGAATSLLTERNAVRRGQPRLLPRRHQNLKYWLLREHQKSNLELQMHFSTSVKSGSELFKVSCWVSVVGFQPVASHSCSLAYTLSAILSCEVCIWSFYVAPSEFFFLVQCEYSVLTRELSTKTSTKY